jgi:hypothetical protein
MEARAVALLRARWRLLAVTAGASLCTAAVFAVALEREDRLDAIAEALAVAELLLPLIVAHGMISGDFRSGVALLWLQKPISPLLFYVRRALEVTLLGVALMLALWGVGTSIAAASLGLDAGRQMLSAAPTGILFVLGVSAILFGFSAWGVQADTLLTAAFVVASTFSLLAGGILAEMLVWVALPVDAIGTLGGVLTGEDTEGARAAALHFARFLGMWAGIGCAGLLYSTRSPLPKEASR